MDILHLLPIIGLLLLTAGGVISWVQAAKGNLDTLWRKHAARLLAQGLSPERTTQWERDTRLWLRVQFWTGLVTMTIFGGCLILYLLHFL